MKTILHVFEAETTPSDAYQAVTTQEGLAGWWQTKVEAGAASTGEHIQFTFEAGFNPKMQIEALEPGASVEWRCVGGAEPWLDNTFRFEVGALPNGKTRIRFWQHYATELDDDTYGTFNFNWGYYMESLRLLLTTGTGNPFTPVG